jgi:uncharacterized protein YjbJ (UPF0337 family)
VLQTAVSMAISNRIKGKLKEVEGKLTGDSLREAEGKVQKAAGKVGQAVKRGVRRAKARMSKAGRKAAAGRTARTTP